MWFAYALAAAVIWGISYATSGRAIARGVSPVVFFFLYTLVGAVCAFLGLALTGKLGSLVTGIRGLGGDWVWLAIVVVTSGLGSLLIYMAIGEKNATVASLIEISYPVFVALFAWLLFKEVQVNLSTVLGGLLILGGVGVVYLGNRG